MINLPVDDSASDEEVMLKDYMDEIKDIALQKLTNLELAALYNDFQQFQYLAVLELGREREDV